ncbi:Crinkler (CRN) family protein [Phytophthora palmivora]|uniref:Crinkler (CRN) family protein n=1 Tax=Phytophthora palmivora TaxID=4796 RepID=A0A2P4XDK3_9STRA|nr:Crinkler (CRN) family protein [Phytophthora palmivora]
MTNVKAEKLKLYLAKKDDGWLRMDDPAALALRKGDSHPFVETAIAGNKFKDKNMKMTGSRGLKPGQFHVLSISCAASDSTERDRRFRAM